MGILDAPIKASAKDAKRLAGPVPVTSGLVSVYTVPAGKIAILTGWVASNNRPDSNSSTYNIYVVPSGAADSINQCIIPNRLLDPGTLPDVFTDVNIPLAAGDQLKIQSASSGIGLILAGVELNA